MFFALSGFLVTGSLMRSQKLQTFIGLRVIRLIPALAVEVVLSALILGPLLTIFELKDYFGSVHFRTYFLNIVGEIHYILPGVFNFNPLPKVVNSQLWTIPYEFYCYLALTVLALIGARRWRAIVPVFAFVSTLGFMVQYNIRFGSEPIEYWQNIGKFAFWSFLWGVSFFQYRDIIPWRGWLFWLATFISVIALSKEGYFACLAPLSIAYATVWLGLTDLRRLWFLRGADYSYGVYLYHWVVMQTVLSLGPKSWVTTAFIGLPLTVAFAALSWHVIEKRALRLRRALVAADSGKEFRWMPIGKFGVIIATGFVLCYHLYPSLHTTFNYLSARNTSLISQADQLSQPVNTLILGDDIVESAYLPTLCGRPTFNGGIGGSKLNDVVQLAPLLVSRLHPQKVLISVGLHDSSVSTGPFPMKFQSDYLGLIRNMKAAGVTVEITTIFPIRIEPESDLFDTEYGSILNGIIRHVSQLEGVGLVDLAHAAPSPLPSAMTINGINLTLTGYTRWREALESACH